MKLCIPVAENRGMGSDVYAHFGSAPQFALHDTDRGTTTFYENADQHHAHGACQPLRPLAGQAVDAIVTGGIGARAVARLNQQGIAVYRAVPGTLADTIAAWTRGELAEISADGACNHHSGCAH